MDNTIILNGIVREGCYCEPFSFYNEKHELHIFIGDTDFPVSKIFGDHFVDKQVTVRYWVSDEEKSKEELTENHLKSIFGSVDAEYKDFYSELSGYLWTDENCMIGGHDLLSILHSFIGKHIYLEIESHGKNINISPGDPVKVTLPNTSFVGIYQNSKWDSVKLDWLCQVDNEWYGINRLSTNLKSKESKVKLRMLKNKLIKELEETENISNTLEKYLEDAFVLGKLDNS